MRIRRSVLASVLLLLVTAGMAQAYMPIALENVIKTWFSSAGKLVGFRIYESPAAPPASGTNDCRLYVDATTDSLMASCNGAAYTYLVGGAATACAEDASGNLTCNSFVTPNLTPNNAMRVYANDADKTCANMGVAGQLTVVDKLGTGNNWCLCDGTTERVCWSNSVPNCVDSGGNHLNYTSATGAWSCGTS